MSVSGLSRPLDLRLKDNLAAVVLTLMGGGLGATSAPSGDSALETVVAGVEPAAAVFVAWAMTREFDPEQRPAALLSAVAMLAWYAIAYWTGADLDPAVFAAGFVLLVARSAARSTGREPTFADALVLGVVAAVAATGAPGMWVVAAALVVGILGTRLLAGRVPLRPPWVGLVVVATVVGYLIRHDGPLLEVHPAGVAVALVAVCLLLSWALVGAATSAMPLGKRLRKPLASEADDGSPVAFGGVLAGRIVTAAALAAAVLGGGTGQSTAPLLTAAFASFAVHALRALPGSASRPS